MAQPAKSVLWVDDEAELLEPHRMFLRDKGFEVETATNADDAVEMVRRRRSDLVLLDEQMPGKRGLEALRELREIDPNLADRHGDEERGRLDDDRGLGRDIDGYLVKPVDAASGLRCRSRACSRAPRIRQQAVARAIRRALSRPCRSERCASLDWRGWIDRYSELTQWDLDLAAANETGLYESLQGLYPDLRREFALFMKHGVSGLAERISRATARRSRSTSSPEFLLPMLKHGQAGGVRRHRLPAARSVARARADASRRCSTSRRRTTSACCRRRRRTRATRCSADCFPARSRRAFPIGGASARTRRSTPTSASCSRRSSQELKRQGAGALREDLDRRRGRRPRAAAGARDRARGHLARSSSTSSICSRTAARESAILYEVARDEIALRQLTLAVVPAVGAVRVLQEAARRKVKVLVTSDHGSIHCRTPATVFAKRDATQNLRYKFGEDLRAENPEQALLFTNEDSLKLPRRGLGANTLLATGDSFFVYPTKLREYQSRYRGSFLHGGVTPEECILPVSLLTPRR